MSEYIERGAKSICRSCFHSCVCEQFNEHRESNNKKCHFYISRYVKAADVVEVKHGKWEFGELDVLGAPVKCSRCGFGFDRADPLLWLDYDGHKFCGNCGAKMDGGADK